MTKQVDFLHVTASGSPIRLTGDFYLAGDQKVDVAPKWVAEAFESMPRVMQIAVNTDTGGVVYQRINRDKEAT